MATSRSSHNRPVTGESARPAHVPVLLKEVLHFLQLEPGLTVVDGTVGAAGHSREIERRIAPSGMLIGLDRDALMLDIAAHQLSGPSSRLIQASYAELPQVLARLAIPAVDRILLDLGLSSDQLADESRGFSFSSEGPLDLRFDPTQGESASELVARLDEQELAAIFERFGEEPESRRFARNLVAFRAGRPIRTARDFAEAVAGRRRRGQTFVARQTSRGSAASCDARLSGAADRRQSRARTARDRPSRRAVSISQAGGHRRRHQFPLAGRPPRQTGFSRIEVMATPQPETDNSLPRRAAFQSPVALGAAAGGEKIAGGENELTKPAPRTSFAASAALNAPLPSLASPPPMSRAATAPKINDPAPAAEPGEKAATPAVPDWGLSKKKPRGRGKFKFIVAGLVLACAGGGYVAYIQFFEKNSATETSALSPDDERPDSATGDDPTDSLSNADSLGDPFDDDPPARPVGNRSPAKAEPGRVDTSPDARPIARRKSPERPSAKNPLRESLALDDDEVPEIADDADALRLTQTEPDAGEESSGRSRGERAALPRRPGSATNSDAGGERPAGRTPHASAGPRLLEIADDGNDRLPDERLDGYSVSGQRSRPASRNNAGGRAISIVEAQDDEEQNEKLDGYAPQSATTRRATSKTVVVRRAEALGDDFTPARGNSADDRVSRPRQSVGNSGGQRVVSPPPADKRLSSATRTFSSRDDVSEPAGDIYRVAPDDNFWKISRSQYGTSRYYLALMRHNREQVPDPQKLRPGTQIMTPPAAVLEQRYPDLIEKSSSSTVPSKSGVDRSALRPAFERPAVGDDPDDRTTRVERDEQASGYFYGRNGEPLYRIGADDTLGSIAQRHLGRASRWHEIFAKNQDVLKTPDNLTLGTVIRLPADASRLGLAPEADRRR